MSGDLIEKEFFKKIRHVLESRNEEFALFQGHELFKFDLKDRLNKPSEKDFIILNNTHQYICGVEVKRTLSGFSIFKSANQLKDTKASLESWFKLDLFNKRKNCPKNREASVYDNFSSVSFVISKTNYVAK